MNNATKSLPIHVCFIAPKAYPLFNPDIKEVFGGSEVDLYFIATELAKDHRFKVSVIVADYGQMPIETAEEITIIKSFNFRQNPLTAAIRLWRAFREADADIYVIKTVSLGVSLLACFCRLYRKMFIYRTSSSPECDGSYQKQHFFVGKAFNRALRQADIVLTQNNSDKDSLNRNIGISSVVIANGHSLPICGNYQRDFILWVGRSDWIKKPELFIELAKRFPSERFVMICQRATGDKEYDRLLTYAAEAGNLQFIERVEFNEIDSYFQRAKVFVNTSIAEGFPNTFIEACKSAVPILSLAVNPDGFLDKHNCGQNCDGQFEKLVDSLRFMLDEDRFITLGRNARSYAEQNHDIREIIQEYQRLFIGLVRSNKPFPGK